MKKNKTGIMIAILVTVCAFLFCTDNNPEGGDNPTGKTVVGEWREIIGKVPFVGLNSDIIVNLTVAENDSTFLLEIVEDDDKDTLYLQYGTWEINENPIDTINTYTLFLFGDSSFVRDTSANPDTLMPVTDSLATDTAYLDTTGSTGNQWQIYTKDIAPFLGGLPVDPSVISTYLPVILLDRQTRK